MGPPEKGHTGRPMGRSLTMQMPTGSASPSSALGQSDTTHLP